MQRSIYIADDEENIREIVKSFLESEGYLVQAFANGDQLMASFQHNPCDLVILDIMMPGSSGFTVCSKLRQVSTVPIIMLTARDSDLDYVTGINLGSDDYFTKPFSAMSLVMRVKAIFRRIDFDKQEKEETPEQALRFGDIIMDMKSKTVMLGGSPLELTPNEFNFLVYLMSHKDRAVSRDELLNKVWGYSSAVETRAADDTVRRLRKKLLGSKVMIDTVWGYGFRLKVREAHE